MRNTRKSYVAEFAVAVLITLAWNQNVQAMEQFLGWWQEEYSGQSASGESACQLCHKNVAGGNGWNPYGWDVRFAAGEDFLKPGLIAALRSVENFNSGNGNTYLQEIQANTQPGWREGVVNLIRYTNGTADETIAPPGGLCGTVDEGSDPIPCPIIDPIPSSIPVGDVLIRLDTVASGFTAPVMAVSAPGEPESIYVVEQIGRIQRVNLATGSKEQFLDFSSAVVSDLSNGFDERGLLGLAFHPDYENNSKIYTHISKDYVEGAEHFSTMPEGIDPDHQAVISEWLVINPQSSSAMATNELELLVIDEPQFNHNGGTVEFGPDGYLYIALGDGGNANDEGDGHGVVGNGQNDANPLGAILRIDVDDPTPLNGRYGIPTSNPFFNIPGKEEIYLFGFRNPYRFSFEELPNDEFNLYVGDVGQNAIEELDRIHSTEVGGNYGWNYKEGSFYFYNDANGVYVSDLPPPGVILPPLIDPVAEYDHDEGLSIIGGHVYTGANIESLHGKYVFADWSGRLFYLDEHDAIQEFKYENQPNLFITGFGKDSQNELYTVGSQSFQVSSQTGELKKIVLGSEDLCMPIKTSNGKVAVICL